MVLENINKLFGIYAAGCHGGNLDSAYRKSCPQVSLTTRPKLLVSAVIKSIPASVTYRVIAEICRAAVKGRFADEILELDPDNTYTGTPSSAASVEFSGITDPSAIYAALNTYGDADICGSLCETDWMEAVQAASLQLLRWCYGD